MESTIPARRHSDIALDYGFRAAAFLCFGRLALSPLQAAQGEVQQGVILTVKLLIRNSGKDLGCGFFFNFFQNIACDIKIKSYICIVNDTIQININH